MSLPINGITSSFQDFQRQQQQGFADFKKDFDQSFKEYQKSFKQAFESYQEELKSNWSQPLITDRHLWVEYYQDNTSRSIVDFENNEIRIELDNKRTDDPSNKAVELLFNVMSRSINDAVENDEVTQRAISNAGLPNDSLGLSGHDRVLSEVNPAHIEEKLGNAKVSHRQEPSSDGDKRNIIILTVPLPATRTTDKAREFLPLVNRYAKQYNIEPALILAIMHSESSFNPMARSHIPAFGLMQIVPGSAGKDVAQEVYGEIRVFTPTYLYNPENNIRAGAVYLNILNTRYLRQIDNPESRLYAVISAYNTGAGNVSRTFTGNSNSPARAAQIINTMQPMQVYSHLHSQLPYEETRKYLEHVAKRTIAYRNFN